MLVIAYALSPVDLIPDFIPVLGLLDDLILLPIAIYFVVKLIPGQIIKEASEKATTYEWAKERNWYSLIFVAFIWLLSALLLYRYFTQ